MGQMTGPFAPPWYRVNRSVTPSSVVNGWISGTQTLSGRFLRLGAAASNLSTGRTTPPKTSKSAPAKNSPKRAVAASRCATLVALSTVIVVSWVMKSAGRIVRIPRAVTFPASSSPSWTVT